MLTLQNGIDSVDLISRFVPREQIVAGAIYVKAVVASPGVISSPGGSTRLVVDQPGEDPVVSQFVWLASVPRPLMW